MNDLEESLSAKVDRWRREAMTRDFTADEYKEVLDALRSGRVAAGKAAVAKRSSKEPVNVDALQDEIDNI